MHEEKKQISTGCNFRQNWKIFASDASRNTRNLIREIVEDMKFEPNPAKQMIALSIGDPTLFGNLQPAPEIIDAIQRNITSMKLNGYAPSTGYDSAREAIAAYTSKLNDVELNTNDVIICSGCSGALDICITALASRGQNILIPKPGFSIYTTLAGSLGVEVKHYDLMPDQQWQINLPDLESKIDSKTAAIVVINPSNPCGSVYTKNHLRDILAVAEKYFLPIISDEIYEHIVFPGVTYTSLGAISTKVPVLACSGLSKRFLVPGWRMGWIVVYDRYHTFDEEIRDGLKSLCARILGANTLVQGALSDIFRDTPQKFYDNLVETLAENAQVAYNILRKCPGMTPILPQGAMYMMVGVDFKKFKCTSTMEFTTKLVEAESVFCLPGECFNFPGFVRLVITLPQQLLVEACQRIVDFCSTQCTLIQVT